MLIFLLVGLGTTEGARQWIFTALERVVARAALVLSRHPTARLGLLLYMVSGVSEADWQCDSVIV